MAKDEVQKRKRRRGPGARTGCGTCRLRRIKCDEAKPICQRCSTTGRKCDGYISDIAIFNQPLPNSTSLSQRISGHVPRNTEEKRSFEFFLRNTAAELSGYYDSSFWEKMILAASAQNCSLRHAVIAIGALHEDFSKKGLATSAQSTDATKKLFAINQYVKGIGALRRSLSNEKEEPLMALMSCMLFVCFDSLRGYFESSMIHLRSRLEMLKGMRWSSAETLIIKDHIVPLLRRLSLQSVIYLDGGKSKDQTSIANVLFAATAYDVAPTAYDVAAPEEFSTLQEARNTLHQAADGLFKVLYMWDANLPLILQPTESIDLLNKHLPQLAHWDTAFEKFMVSRARDLSSRELQGAALLRIHYTTTKIMSGVQGDINDMRPVSEVANSTQYSKYLEDFRTIVSLSTSLDASAEQYARTGQSPLTFSSDLGLIGPLHYVCIKCQVVSIRAAAMELLLRRSTITVLFTPNISVDQ